jgi:hypothetical protein
LVAGTGIGQRGPRAPVACPRAAASSTDRSFGGGRFIAAECDRRPGRDQHGCLEGAGIAMVTGGGGAESRYPRAVLDARLDTPAS